MKKIFKIIVLILVIIVLLSLLSIIVSKFTTKYKLEYETWFDTKNVFGNGEYQQYTNDNGGLDLFNMKYNCPIINSVTSHIEQDDKVFFKGYIYGLNYQSLEVLVVLDLKTNVIKYYVIGCKYEDYMILYSRNMIRDKKLIIINHFDEFNTEEQNDFKLLNIKHR